MATVQGIEGDRTSEQRKGPPGQSVAPGEFPEWIYGNNQPPVTIYGRRRRPAPAHPGRPLPDHDLRHRSRGQEAPRDSARLPPRSGARLPAACRFHAARARRQPIRVSVPLHIVNAESAPGAEARLHGQYRHPTPSIWNARSTTFRNLSRPMSAGSRSTTRCICRTSSCRPT